MTMTSAGSARPVVGVALRAVLQCMTLLLALLAGSYAQAADTLAAGGLDELADRALMNAILAYYQAEKARDWQTTYALRGARFAAVVPYATYARQMDIDAGGWELVAIDGRSARVDGALTEVTVSFQEDLAHQVAARLLGAELVAPVDTGTSQRYSQTEVTQWTMADGQWIALMPGARQHFVFNERMVWE